ncbi:oligoribonuclease [Brachybacterium sp. UMB0905]|uniref:oligoribonuclease n=1 Tax=Brachybacterium sp. UMB0905 TaxID=2069310 RepID=UPI000C80E44B|nr:oligoribonuclease [Brachybacterium sp. UMB0905]PMC76590.1 oligoribonuclease [Brachybacterium sp. UMB0905]
MTSSSTRAINDRIIWVDCEMTGLDKQRDALVEIAVLVTDADLNILGDGVDVVIKPPAEALQGMDPFVVNMHTVSGLLEELDGGMTLAEAEAQCLAYVKEFCPEPGKAPLAGNSVGTDRTFLDRDVPEFAGWLSYRTIDVSSLKELAKRWFPRVYYNIPAKHGGHRALADIRESIQELKYYRQVLIVPEPGPTTAQAQEAARAFELRDTQETAVTDTAARPHLPWLDRPSHHTWLEAEGDELLMFGSESVREDGGFAWLNSQGQPDLSRPAELWITCRMTHCFALGHLMGRPGLGRLADHGLTSLRDVFRDEEHGGWYSAVADGSPVDDSKQAYAHAFVVLAAASCTAAGRPGARELLDEALTVLDEKFFDEAAGMSVDSFDRTFTDCEQYRGINANMHTVEGLLAAADVTGERRWLDRAVGIATRAIDEFARANDWALPEHFDVDWNPLLDYNKDQPAHPFRPYGATIGHWIEWARLVLHARAALIALDGEAPEWMLEAATALMEKSAAAFGADGQPGFVYTVDWDGTPVSRERMHWVPAEAVGAAAVMYQVTGERVWAERYEQWWAYISAYLLDPEDGSWFHELDQNNAPQGVTWPGKPDIYHAYQATLIPRLPVTPTLAAAMRDGLLDSTL